MELLESAMAFAVVMIMFSTLVSGIVEFVFKLFAMRESNLQTTIEGLFNSVIWPRMKHRLHVEGTIAEDNDIAGIREEFVKSMIDNPAAGQPSRLFKYIPTFRQNHVDTLTLLSFAERLGRTKVGTAILEEGEEHLNVLITEFTRSFDRFGRAASEVFKKKTHYASMVIGILMALVVNVDAGRLFTSLVENPTLRGGLISQVEEAVKTNKEATNQLKDVMKQLDEGSYDGKIVEEFKLQSENILTVTKALEGQGLPIGHDYFPMCQVNSNKYCKLEGFKYFSAYLAWIFMCVLAGILIGLGGPFWFRFFSGLSQVFQVLKALGVGGRQPQQESTDSSPAEKNPEDTAKPQTIKDAFVTAAIVYAYPSGTGSANSTDT